VTTSESPLLYVLVFLFKSWKKDIVSLFGQLSAATQSTEYVGHYGSPRYAGLGGNFTKITPILRPEHFFVFDIFC
jgi:hypothetical protein